MKKKGKFIVIEGTDGSGKHEQFLLLKRALMARGVRVKTVDFPQYGKKSAYFAERYLNGDYGAWSGSHERLVSIFYALDRFDVGFTIQEWLRKGYMVLANRYVASNMGHQGAKILNTKKRREFIQWIHDLEYQFFGIPKPDLNIVLSVPPTIAYRLIAKKKQRKYLRGKKRDIHEVNAHHLVRAAKVYEEIAKRYPREFTMVHCAPQGKLLSIKEIHERVLKVVL